MQSPTEASTNTAPAPCGVIPSIAQAYSFNLTVVPAGAAGAPVDYVSLWPSGSPQPFVSTLDDPQGLIVSNAAIVPAGAPYGGVSVYNAGPATTDVIIDMNGYFAAPSDLNGNTAVGSSALANDTPGEFFGGIWNTAIGSDALQANTTGSQNTASGSFALQANTTGTSNTASGSFALQANTTGGNNTASGAFALNSNTTGGSNTASGVGALQANTNGNNNTADGSGALQQNTSGSNNTASGGGALGFNTTGIGNTASGASALQANTTGGGNTANGANALQNNTIGVSNTASGSGAMQSNTTGNGNTASGLGALSANTTGNGNTAIGDTALQSNTTGSNNVAIGNLAAVGVSGGNSNNIHIGSLGASADSSVVRIGGTQTSAYIAGISGASVSGGAAVYVTSSGQLGTVLSSRRFKEQITDMGDTSSKLLQLRPVNFFYKPQYDDGSHLLQYGLIAEEVAKVYPEMVAYDKDGRILTVKYQLLAPMLLNELQKQAAQNRSLEERVAALEALLANLKPAAAQPASSQ